MTRHDHEDVAIAIPTPATTTTTTGVPLTIAIAYPDCTMPWVHTYIVPAFAAAEWLVEDLHASIRQDLDDQNLIIDLVQ